MKHIDTPSLVPDQVPSSSSTVYIVLDDFGALGRAYRETDENAADLESIVGNLISGQYENPIEIIAFNKAKGRCTDVSEGVARAVSARVANIEDLPASTQQFLHAYLREPVR